MTSRTTGAFSLNHQPFVGNGGRLAGRHPHHLLGHAIRFLLVDISRLADGELCLNQFIFAARAAAAAGATRLALEHEATRQCRWM